MCGIVGIWGSVPDKVGLIGAACRRMRHRGPDDTGFWEDAEAGLAFGHVRLAIVDLSAAGHQPMVSACGRYVMVLNGEIYNHMELRSRLEQGGLAPAWRGHSDTETLLACFAALGVEATLRSTVGMFAVALWDRTAQSLVLARDRMGEKPLYYGYAGASLVFASELKALAGVPDFGRELDRRALTLLMRHNYIPAPHSIYQGVAKLPPGAWVEILPGHVRRRDMPAPQTYWSAQVAAANARATPLAFDSDQAAVDALEGVLKEAVRTQLMADVPLGAFLSGGIDSSTIAALMQAQSGTPVRTFAIGFHEKGYNEAEYAKAVARHLGTEHTEHYVTAQDALDVVPNLPDIYDEPFADASQIPTTLVMRMARRHVTVALSGDGGDELFGGYLRYHRVQRWWDQCARMPRPLRKPLGRVLAAASSLPGKGAWLGKAAKLGELMCADTRGAFYRNFVSYWSDPASVVVDGEEPETPFGREMEGGLYDAMMELDAITYLPDDILVKVDRAAMSVSLETRVPLLDHRVYEFAWSLPLHYKVRRGTGKWILRQVLYRHVPRELVDRPKKGFGVPLAAWLRGPLRDWGEALLDESRLRNQGLFRPEPIRRKWDELQRAHRDWAPHLWGVLMTQAWLDRHHAQGVR
jgi:asparagine synthase (glutamine-hydrolyzing)